MGVGLVQQPKQVWKAEDPPAWRPETVGHAIMPNLPDQRSPCNIIMPEGPSLPHRDVAGPEIPVQYRGADDVHVLEESLELGKQPVAIP